MTSSTIEQLKTFINKPVTIFTENIGRNFQETQYNDYFTGICTNVTFDIIETIHPVTKCKNIFFIRNIVGICEEQQLDPKNPEHKKIIEEIYESKTVDKDLPLSNSATIDVDLLNKLIDKN